MDGSADEHRDTGFLFHDAFLQHDTGPGHPERPERLEAVLRGLRDSGVWDELDVTSPRLGEAKWIGAVHSREHQERVSVAGSAGADVLDASDTVVSRGSHRAAQLAVGGVLDAADRVVEGKWRNAFVCARPPGHHAERDAAMGFCLFNQVAIGARYLQAHHGIERVAVIDFDVHHGNGTQHAFENDSSVFYASLHQWPWYPGTGSASERGLGDGEGATLNCPLSAGTGDAEWVTAMEEQVLPQVESFRPGFLLVSAGFDAHHLDPLSETKVTVDGYRRLARALLDLARTQCEGRLVAVLEGGYHLEGLAEAATGFITQLRE